jgi:hypothetical protein
MRRRSVGPGKRCVLRRISGARDSESGAVFRGKFVDDRESKGQVV